MKIDFLRILSRTTLILIAILAMACGDEDEKITEDEDKIETTNNLLGEWKAVSYDRIPNSDYYKITGCKTELATDIEDYESYVSSIIRFDDDNTMVCAQGCDVDVMFITKWKLQIEGDYKAVIPEDISDTGGKFYLPGMQIVSVTDNELVLSHSKNSTPEFYITFNRP